MTCDHSFALSLLKPAWVVSMRLIRVAFVLKFLVLPNGNIEVGVHIADVTYFLRHKSPLDVEAQLRSTTFYLVDRRFDM